MIEVIYMFFSKWKKTTKKNNNNEGDGSKKVETFPEIKVEPKNDTLALVDVDQTLIIGEYTAPSYTRTITKDYIKLTEQGLKRSLNQELINALKNSGLFNIVLFTDMSLTFNAVVEREQLVKILENSGFKVHCVSIPADCAWHLSDENFNTNFETLLEKYTSGKLNPGQAFLDGQNLLSKYLNEASDSCVTEFGNSLTLKSINAKILTHRISDNQKLKSIKGELFKYIVTHYGNQYNNYIVFDDNLKVLESIKQVHEMHFEKKEIFSIHVSNGLPPKQSSPITPKTYQEYHKEISDILNPHMDNASAKPQI